MRYWFFMNKKKVKTKIITLNNRSGNFFNKNLIESIYQKDKEVFMKHVSEYESYRKEKKI
ncbi:hypothetical protein QIA30_06235 (plasmid) [Borreliella turdi]|uniref:hypothetical protein n=1 Tax=Borreliella turdi TaxID=57863 RepID=UPI003AF13E07